LQICVCNVLRHWPRAQKNGANFFPQDWSPHCENSSALTNLYNFSIRAITNDPGTGEKFLSPWSREVALPANCAGQAFLDVRMFD
jgi:hypothetical protein